MKTVTVIYPGGRATFARAYLAGFVSFEDLKASVVLEGVKGRDEVLRELYRQSHPEDGETPAAGTKKGKKKD